MTARVAFNLGTACLLAGIASLFALNDAQTLWTVCIGLGGLVLVFAGILLVEVAEELEELEEMTAVQPKGNP